MTTGFSQFSKNIPEPFHNVHVTVAVKETVYCINTCAVHVISVQCTGTGAIHVHAYTCTCTGVHTEFFAGGGGGGGGGDTSQNFDVV